MKNKKLIETFMFRSSVPQESFIYLDNMISRWGDVSRPELSVYLVHLRFLRDVAHQAHWLAKSPSFVGDHDLLSDIYTTTCNNYDAVGERCLMLSDDPRSVDLQTQMKQTYELIAKNAAGLSLTDINSRVMQQMLNAERTFLVAADELVKRLKASNALSRGTDNVLAGIEDTHEQFTYKLMRRNHDLRTNRQ